jgi:hypothetical protein
LFQGSETSWTVLSERAKQRIDHVLDTGLGKVGAKALNVHAGKYRGGDAVCRLRERFREHGDAINGGGVARSAEGGSTECLVAYCSAPYS